MEGASDIDKGSYQMNSHLTYSFAHKHMRILQKTGRKLNVVGIGNHELTGLDAVTDACPLKCSSGQVFGIFPEYDCLEVFKTQVMTAPLKLENKLQKTEEKTPDL